MGRTAPLQTDLDGPLVLACRLHHLTAFADGVRPERIDRFADVEDFAEDDEVTAPDGSAWGPSDFIVNCPVVMRVR